MPQLGFLNGKNGTQNGHGYEALSRVGEGSDAELLEKMFGFYPTIAPEPNLDATYHAGRVWAGS